ncbi:DUF2156 domain-containing protein [Desulfovibrio litoralis]|uniref:Phosphatidylglycerol lysyltransferase C-terminal domain-containing protein n=1 Tax=Desulfovibrio litoralis DSM 11393 TaxID=1121455 RepID=A0A1M7RWT1_9BACT|nr:phosphatidylglycerol lysyltransferase domain-containing protein [Desulfovibrio litoralis]SHN50472.1 hypothetical protein SAMN02745728_00249 [Desulfovibrio litoralis DSM 11393]
MATCFNSPCQTEFVSVNLGDANKYLQLHALSGTRASDYSLGNLWGWADYYGLEWGFCHSLCWIRQTRPEPCCWSPIGDWKNIDWTAFAIAPGTKIIRVPEELLNIWEKAYAGRLQVEESRGQWDYIYNSQELASLKGNRFHKKRNHYNSFLKSYEYKYTPMSQDCVEEVLVLQDQWIQWREDHDSAMLLAENEAVYRVLKHWEDIPNLSGGTIRIDGNLVAYTVAEPLADDTLVIHFEKGKNEYKGIYQAINTLFAQEIANDYQFLNREQDLDDPGLRKAKESYNPVSYVKKYTVSFK